jgi:hypothetical protein
LQKLLSDSDAQNSLAFQARKGVEEKFHLKDQVGKMIRIYQSATEDNKNL